MSEETELLPFEELDSHLQEEVIEHFKNDPYLVPDDWMESIIETVEGKYEGLNIDPDSVTYDFSYNDIHWKGTLDINNPEIEELIPKKYFEYDNMGFITHFSEDFEDGEMTGEFKLDEGVISDLEPGDVLPVKFVSSKHGIVANASDIETYRSLVKTHSIEDKEIIDAIQRMLDAFDAAELFFQDDVELSDDDYYDVAEAIIENTDADQLIQEVEWFMEEEAFEGLNQYVEDAFDYFSKLVVENYEWHFSDEYIKDTIGEREFEVVFDEGGEQESIVDLNGQW